MQRKKSAPYLFIILLFWFLSRRLGSRGRPEPVREIFQLLTGLTFLGRLRLDYIWIFCNLDGPVLVALKPISHQSLVDCTIKCVPVHEEWVIGVKHLQKLLFIQRGRQKVGQKQRNLFLGSIQPVGIGGDILWKASGIEITARRNAHMILYHTRVDRDAP